MWGSEQNENGKLLIKIPQNLKTALLSTGLGHTLGKAALPVGDHHTHAQVFRKHAELAGVQGATSVTLLGTGTGSLLPGANCPGHPGLQSFCLLRPPAGDGESVKLSIPFTPDRTPPSLLTSPSPMETKKQVHYCLSLRPGWMQEGTDLPSKRCVWRGGGHTRVYLLCSLHLFREELPPRIQPVATRGLCFSHGSCRAVFSAFYLFLREQTHYTSCI